MSANQPSKSHPLILFTNHMDAWGVTFIIVSVYMLIHQAFDSRAILLLGLITAGYWFGFAVNDYFDAEIDCDEAKKARKNFFVQYPLSKNGAQIATFMILACLFLGFLQFGWQGILIFAVSICIVWGYSAPPLRLKSRPILDLITHALFVQTFPYLMCIFLIRGQELLIDYWLVGFFFCSSLSAQLEQQTRDYALDKAHDNNFTVYFGTRSSLFLQKIATIILLLIGIFSLVFAVLPPILVPVGLLGLPLLFHRLLRRNETPRSERLIKVSVILVVSYIVAAWIFTLWG